MKTKFKAVLLILLFIAAAALTVWYINGHNIAVLEPKGIIAIKERNLIITSTLLMLIVVIPVYILTLAFAWKYRADGKGKHTPDWEDNTIAECCWWGVPLVIIIILAIITWKSSHELNPFRPIESNKKPVTIQAVALQWKWLFIYPEHGIATVNIVQFPEKTPLNFEITADAPMNSFWIPQLGGQIYAMPAMMAKLHLMANETGTYQGRSSNLSGHGFAGMGFKAISTSQKDFDQWIRKVRQSFNQLTFDEYEKLVKPASYVPAAYYSLPQSNLFHQIIDKYSPPQR